MATLQLLTGLGAGGDRAPLWAMPQGSFDVS